MERDRDLEQAYLERVFMDLMGPYAIEQTNKREVARHFAYQLAQAPLIPGLMITGLRDEAPARERRARPNKRQRDHARGR